LTNFSKNSKNETKNFRPLQVALLHTVCQADRRTDVTRLTFAFYYSFTKAPQNSGITAGVGAEF